LQVCWEWWLQSPEGHTCHKCYRGSFASPYSRCIECRSQQQRVQRDLLCWLPWYLS
jgi:hypothetical protein